MGKKTAIKTMLNPQSIAVVGARRDSNDNLGAWMDIFGRIAEFGFKGRLYPINPKAETIAGCKAYPSLAALPERVDLVVVTLSAKRIPSVFEECTATGNKNIIVFSSGFQETGQATGRRLHEAIEKIAQEGKLHVMGPNCMGLYIPKAGVGCWRGVPKESGSVAFLSQSGGFAEDFTSFAVQFNVRFSRVVSYGNALTIDCNDLLEYVAKDDDTRLVTMYLEGVDDGLRFLEQVSKINRKKPVVIMKTGQSQAAIRAISSHTGAMAGEARSWDAFFRQTGAIRVRSVEDLTDMVVMLQHSNTLGGNRVAIIGTGGGYSVAATDACVNAGLEVPEIPEKMQKKLGTFIPAAGNIIRNPVDADAVMADPSLLSQVLETICRGAFTDMLLVNFQVDWLTDYFSKGTPEKMAEFIALQAGSLMAGKPLAVVLRSYRVEPVFKASREQMERILRSAGIPVFRNIEQPIGCLARLSRYYEFLKRRA
ncbi:MAG: CoA-binding protein [Deltaproteobacteria bacterium]|nr:CoA-binding protein [Deltaproteobacteria bacterium]